MILMFPVRMQVRTLVCPLPLLGGLKPPNVRSGYTGSGITRIDNERSLSGNIGVIKGPVIGDDDHTVSTLQMLVVKWNGSQHCFLECQCWYIGIRVINMRLLNALQ